VVTDLRRGIDSERGGGGESLTGQHVRGASQVRELWKMSETLTVKMSEAQRMHMKMVTLGSE
jgi:hypothetical protein